MLLIVILIINKKLVQEIPDLLSLSDVPNTPSSYLLLLVFKEMVNKFIVHTQTLPREYDLVNIDLLRMLFFLLLSFVSIILEHIDMVIINFFTTLRLI